MLWLNSAVIAGALDSMHMPEFPVEKQRSILYPGM
jgi:hypothetical protein